METASTLGATVGAPYLGDATYPRPRDADRVVLVGREDTGHPDGGLVELDGETWYRVRRHDALPPFLMSLVSDSDHWMFVSSNGGLTAGRRSPDSALFPYYTDDRIHDGCEQTGSRTVVRVDGPGRCVPWEPFSARGAGVHRVTRLLDKATVGNQVRFEETNHDLGLTFAYTWTSSDRFGFVRYATLTNHGDLPVTLDLLDGLQNVLPAGVGRAFQEHYSTLVDAYKHNELDQATGIALMRLASVPTDAAEPSEALRTTVVWSVGLEPVTRLLSTAQLDRFRAGVDVEPETEVRGQRGAYLLATRLTLPTGGTRRWVIIADVEQDAADLVALRRLLLSGSDVGAAVDADVRRGTQALVGIVAAADGVQVTEDELSSWRHFSDVLFNVMRGGLPIDGYVVSSEDFRRYVAAASTTVRARRSRFLTGLPDRLTHRELVAAAVACADPDLERLAREYLPLTFSRRHGDPSRPWNDFTIAVKDEQGQRILGYQGNWRDIFQNWEALAYSFPEYAESMIVKFLDASTADGYNPYRLTWQGFDWEELDPQDPWSHVGYWGDHQVIYLLRLLEVSGQLQPGALGDLLDRRLFTYADVPYRLKDYPALLADPRHTINFDEARNGELRRRITERGAEGALLLDAHGAPVRVTLAEKLLLVALARLGSYLPGAGIWLNTQRPEWNDANNALVGFGVSMVTLYHVRRYLAHVREVVADVTGSVRVGVEVTGLLRRIAGVLREHRGMLAGPVDDQERKAVLDALGTAAADHRAALYANGLSGKQVAVPVTELSAFCDLALDHLDHTVRLNRRPDGLYHSYNLMQVDGDAIRVRHLPEMLEGQVAVLGSRALDLAESVALLDAVRASALHRPDLDSYLLYPDQRLPHFLDRNVVPPSALERSPLLAAMVEHGDRRIVVRDIDGGLHFNAAFRSARDLRATLAAMATTADTVVRERVEADTPVILDLYEEVFDHQSFTGRSATFYKYEGLGCVYWHMVSKLRLAVLEILERAGRDEQADPKLRERLRVHYEAIRAGLGVHASPKVHGAVPVNPYSHTPGFAGAQQPGMTGQVKEDIIARLGELGLTIDDGRLRWRPDLVRSRELLTGPRTMHWSDTRGFPHVLELPAGTLGSTICQVPVVLHADGPPRIVVTASDGGTVTVDGLHLDRATSAEVFGRTGTVARLDAFLDLTLAAGPIPA